MSESRADMFIDPESDPRADPPPQADERSTLAAFLRWQRETLELKCSGLSPEQLARRTVEPSTMSLLGLIRHMADVERGWFRRGMAQEPATPRFYSDDEPDGDFDGAVADAEVVAEAWRAWREEVEFAERFVADARSLDITFDDKWRGPLSLRWVLLHMIEEYARHNGHADLMREQIDGRLGQ
ncbi:MAG TPA: DinB family protein [Actinospica sp.]|nr:DinB family protein [Actinospica sp.]HWG24730.1 DinB family protein [Actinospica sp.]